MFLLHFLFTLFVHIKKKMHAVVATHLRCRRVVRDWILWFVFFICPLVMFILTFFWDNMIGEKCQSYCARTIVYVTSCTLLILGYCFWSVLMEGMSREERELVGKALMHKFDIQEKHALDMVHSHFDTSTVLAIAIDLGVYNNVEDPQPNKTTATTTTTATGADVDEPLLVTASDYDDVGVD